MYLPKVLIFVGQEVKINFFWNLKSKPKIACIFFWRNSIRHSCIFVIRNDRQPIIISGLKKTKSSSSRRVFYITSLSLLVYTPDLSSCYRKTVCTSAQSVKGMILQGQLGDMFRIKPVHYPCKAWLSVYSCNLGITLSPLPSDVRLHSTYTGFCDKHWEYHC